MMSVGYRFQRIREAGRNEISDSAARTLDSTTAPVNRSIALHTGDPVTGASTTSLPQPSANARTSNRGTVFSTTIDGNGSDTSGEAKCSPSSDGANSNAPATRDT